MVVELVIPLDMEEVELLISASLKIVYMLE
jgi:hypothetical protein